MPALIQGEVDYGLRRVQEGFGDIKYDYGNRYPDGLDLSPSSDLHQEIVSKILVRARASHNEMSTRFDSWNLIDRSMTAYIPSDEDEDKVKAKDSRRPISIVFPYSYAMEETLLSYLMAAFTQDPIFRYEGVDGDDIIGTSLMELVIQLHCIKTKVGLALHTYFRDALRYGIGVVSPSWETVVGRRRIKIPGQIMNEYGELIEGPPTVGTVESITFEGNKLYNIDPYRYLPDPNMPVQRVQEGEFVGWTYRSNYVTMLSEEEHDENMFNVQYLQHLKHHRSFLSPDNSDREKGSGRSQHVIIDVHDVGVVDTITKYVNIIPREWNLGTSERPEKWCFVVAGDAILIKAYKLDFDHDKFLVAPISPDFDGYSPTPISKLEILYGLQNVLDWLFNSHIANVRKAVNDMIIVDPQMVNVNDLKSDKPGKLIRLRRPAWGRGVKDVAMQLTVNDITRQNIADSDWIVRWMQKIVAADDVEMGSIRKGGPERLTGAEFKGTQFGKVNRLERMARVIGMQGMQDIGEFFASHLQQFMTEDQIVRVTGRDYDKLTKQFGSDRVRVSPLDIAISYDSIVRDGSVPGGNFSDAWLGLYRMIIENPEATQQIDTYSMFEYIARQMGAKNIEDFKRKGGDQRPVETQVLPDEEVERQAQAGNIRPIS